MPTPYTTGTVSITNGSATVTGTGTLWASLGIVPGDHIEVEGRYCAIANVVSNTEITLLVAWTSSTISAKPYAILFDAPSRTAPTTLVEKIRELINAIGIYQKIAPFFTVQSVGDNTPPSMPADDDMYVVGTIPTDAWSGHANNIAQWTGSEWAFTIPENGWMTYAIGDQLYIYDSGWVSISGG